MRGSDRRSYLAADGQRRLTGVFALAAALPLLGGCDGEERHVGEVDETPAALDAPALAPNRLVEDPPPVDDALEPP